MMHCTFPEANAQGVSKNGYTHMVYTKVCPFKLVMEIKNGYEFTNPDREKGTRTHDTTQLRGKSYL